MARYDYRCTACDSRFEVDRPMGSTEAVCCPECGADAKRVFTPVGVAFKGSGFHNTDYKPRPKEDSCPNQTSAPS
jgi:putative FmdB family regulatory protein